MTKIDKTNFRRCIQENSYYTHIQCIEKERNTHTHIVLYLDTVWGVHMHQNQYVRFPRMLCCRSEPHKYSLKAQQNVVDEKRRKSRENVCTHVVERPADENPMFEKFNLFAGVIE